MKTIYLSIFLTFWSLATTSQNLVLNPSFEDSEKECAEIIGDFDRHTTHWSTPTVGSSDIFNPCARGRTGVPYNFSGHQVPEYGEKYAGAYLFHAERNYREYIQGTFSSTLEKGKKYKVSFYVSLAETSDYAIKNIGFLLSERQLNSRTNSAVSQEKLNATDITRSFYALYEMPDTDFYEDKNEWMQLSIEIEATGKENYISIGNFKDNHATKTKWLSNQKGNNKSYYYFDMVTVEPVAPTLNEQLAEEYEEPELISDPKEMELDKSYIFENIMFDFNSTKLSQPAKEQIKEIHDFLMENSEVNLIVTGHTDSVGSDDYNQKLSENRAKAVATHLFELGLEEERLKLTGFGLSAPITTNSTDKGRSLNRRVEFRITKKSISE